MKRIFFETSKKSLYELKKKGMNKTTITFGGRINAIRPSDNPKKTSHLLHCVFISLVRQ